MRDVIVLDRPGAQAKGPATDAVMAAAAGVALGCAAAQMRPPGRAEHLAIGGLPLAVASYVAAASGRSATR